MSVTREAVYGLSSTDAPPLRYSGQRNHPCENMGILIEYIKDHGRLLDIGCGTGSITEILRDARSLSVVGIEPHPERAEEARKKGFEVVTGIYNEDIVSDFGRFNCILFADVLEHLVDPSQILKDVTKSLSQDGYVLASIPNIAHWSVRLKLLFGSFDYQPTGIMDATHLRWFTRKSVIRLFEVSGYDVSAVRGSAGGWISAYRFTPLHFLTQDQKSSFLGRVCRFLPGLFSAQHVVLARPRKGTGNEMVS